MSIVPVLVCYTFALSPDWTMLQIKHKAIYASFDRFPSTKGAAVHIDRFARVLFDFANGGLLYVLGGDILPSYQLEGNVEIVRFSQPVHNFLQRTVEYGEYFDRLLWSGTLLESLEFAHFRDPWSGAPILHARRSHSRARFQTIYEVNGLPSVELQHRYSSIDPATLDKIRQLEAFCCEQADAIVVPSATIRAALCQRNVPENKIVVIPNGADLPPCTPSRPLNAPERYIIYFGAMQGWQGIDILLRAFAQLADRRDLWLVLCLSHKTVKLQAYQTLADRLGISDRVKWLDQLSQMELASWIANAALSVAPLTNCARNVEQGCAPLKILESMSHGIPVVASDLPCVREILQDGVTGKLVHPDRPAELSRAIRVLLEYPTEIVRLGANAREAIANGLTWSHATDKLTETYRSLEGKVKTA